MNDLYHKLASYGNSDHYGFHMPGHKRNREITRAGLPYEIDITEIEGFDDLHHANGILKKAQERAAKVFHGEETHFLINGSTVGILSAVLGCTQRGETILMARNCHKSVYHAVYMNELKPIYIYPRLLNVDLSSGKAAESYDKTNLPESECGKLNLNVDIKPKEVEKILAENMDSIGKCKIRAVVITSPTYDGVVSNVERIAEIVHSYGIPLIVDEAHGAHFGFHPYFPKNANVKGADVVIHSIHKTLPALTQTALIHINGRLADRERIKKYLHILQSSSPSYILMAGIDACIGWLESEEKDILFDQYTSLLRETREKLKDMQYLKLIETENFDRSKILISVNKTKYTGRQLYMELLEKYHLQMEMAAGSYVLAMTSVGDRKDGFDRLVYALWELDRKSEVCVQDGAEELLIETGTDQGRKGSGEKGSGRIGSREKGSGEKGSGEKGSGEKGSGEKGSGEKGSGRKESGRKELSVPEQVFIPSEAEKMKRNHPEKIKSVLWNCSLGRVSMEYAYLYPPGIPLIVPGEKISEEIIYLIQGYRKMGFQIEGLKKDGYIEIIEMRMALE